jgi:hypothetical protein
LATSELRSVKDVFNWPLVQLERVSKLPSALPELWPDLLDMLEGIPPLLKDDAAKLLAGSSFYDPHAVIEFVNSLRTNRKLLTDLRPAHLQAIADIGFDARLDRIQRSRYLTVARNVPDSSDAGKLFEFFYNLTARYADPPPLAAVAKGLNQRLTAGSIPIIGASRQLPEIDALASDGIVNTLRQLPATGAAGVATELDRVAAIVIADHLDVLGYFPTATPFAEASPNGFLSSGSDFRDREFCALYRSVAGQIAKSIA